MAVGGRLGETGSDGTVGKSGAELGGRVCVCVCLECVCVWMCVCVWSVLVVPIC